MADEYSEVRSQQSKWRASIQKSGVSTQNGVRVFRSQESALRMVLDLVGWHSISIVSRIQKHETCFGSNIDAPDKGLNQTLQTRG
jgi:hypothetical protein